METSDTARSDERAVGFRLVVFWLLVGVPLLWGIANTIRDAMRLFG